MIHDGKDARVYPVPCRQSDRRIVVVTTPRSLFPPSTRSLPLCVKSLFAGRDAELRAEVNLTVTLRCTNEVTGGANGNPIDSIGVGRCESPLSSTRQPTESVGVVTLERAVREDLAHVIPLPCEVDVAVCWGSPEPKRVGHGTVKAQPVECSLVQLHIRFLVGAPLRRERLEARTRIPSRSGAYSAADGVPPLTFPACSVSHVDGRLMETNPCDGVGMSAAQAMREALLEYFLVCDESSRPPWDAPLGVLPATRAALRGLVAASRAPALDWGNSYVDGVSLLRANSTINAYHEPETIAPLSPQAFQRFAATQGQLTAAAHHREVCSEGVDWIGESFGPQRRRIDWHTGPSGSRSRKAPADHEMLTTAAASLHRSRAVSSQQLGTYEHRGPRSPSLTGIDAMILAARDVASAPSASSFDSLGNHVRASPYAINASAMKAAREVLMLPGEASPSSPPPAEPSPTAPRIRMSCSAEAPHTNSPPQPKAKGLHCTTERLCQIRVTTRLPAGLSSPMARAYLSSAESRDALCHDLVEVALQKCCSVADLVALNVEVTPHRPEGSDRDLCSPKRKEDRRVIPEPITHVVLQVDLFIPVQLRAAAHSALLNYFLRGGAAGLQTGGSRKKRPFASWLRVVRGGAAGLFDVPQMIDLSHTKVDGVAVLSEDQPELRHRGSSTPATPSAMGSRPRRPAHEGRSGAQKATSDDKDSGSDRPLDRQREAGQAPQTARRLGNQRRQSTPATPSADDAAEEREQVPIPKDPPTRSRSRRERKSPVSPEVPESSLPRGDRLPSACGAPSSPSPQKDQAHLLRTVSTGHTPSMLSATAHSRARDAAADDSKSELGLSLVKADPMVRKVTIPGAVDAGGPLSDTMRSTVTRWSQCDFRSASPPSETCMHSASASSVQGAYESEYDSERDVRQRHRVPRYSPEDLVPHPPNASPTFAIEQQNVKKDRDPPLEGGRTETLYPLPASVEAAEHAAERAPLQSNLSDTMSQLTSSVEFPAPRTAHASGTGYDAGGLRPAHSGQAAEESFDGCISDDSGSTNYIANQSAIPVPNDKPPRPLPHANKPQPPSQRSSNSSDSGSGTIDERAALVGNGVEPFKDEDEDDDMYRVHVNQLFRRHRSIGSSSSKSASREAGDAGHGSPTAESLTHSSTTGLMEDLLGRLGGSGAEVSVGGSGGWLLAVQANECKRRRPDSSSAGPDGDGVEIPFAPNVTKRTGAAGSLRAPNGRGDRNPRSRRRPTWDGAAFDSSDLSEDACEEENERQSESAVAIAPICTPLRRAGDDEARPSLGGAEAAGEKSNSVDERYSVRMISRSRESSVSDAAERTTLNGRVTPVLAVQRSSTPLPPTDLGANESVFRVMVTFRDVLWSSFLPRRCQLEPVSVGILPSGPHGEIESARRHCYDALRSAFRNDWLSLFKCAFSRLSAVPTPWLPPPERAGSPPSPPASILPGAWHYDVVVPSEIIYPREVASESGRSSSLGTEHVHEVAWAPVSQPARIPDQVSFYALIKVSYSPSAASSNPNDGGDPSSCRHPYGSSPNTALAGDEYEESHESVVLDIILEYLTSGLELPLEKSLLVKTLGEDRGGRHCFPSTLRCAAALAVAAGGAMDMARWRIVATSQPRAEDASTGSDGVVPHDRRASAEREEYVLTRERAERLMATTDEAVVLVARAVTAAAGTMSTTTLSYPPAERPKTEPLEGARGSDWISGIGRRIVDVVDRGRTSINGVPLELLVS